MKWNPPCVKTALGFFPSRFWWILDIFFRQQIKYNMLKKLWPVEQESNRAELGKACFLGTVEFSKILEIYFALIVANSENRLDYI